MSIIIDGQLEIDQERGVIYFHNNETGMTLFRICRLPKPIPDPKNVELFLDVVHMRGASWGEDQISKEYSVNLHRLDGAFPTLILFGKSPHKLNKFVKLYRYEIEEGWKVVPDDKDLKDLATELKFRTMILTCQEDNPDPKRWKRFYVAESVFEVRDIIKKQAPEIVIK